MFHETMGQMSRTHRGQPGQIQDNMSTKINKVIMEYNTMIKIDIHCSIMMTDREKKERREKKGRRKEMKDQKEERVKEFHYSKMRLTNVGRVIVLKNHY